MKRLKILVTGACGVTSRSVVRSLNLSPVYRDKCEFIGTDVCNLEYGLYEGLYEKVYRVPYFNDPGYRDAMERIIAENELEYAIVIPEPEMLEWCERPFDVKFHRIPPKFGRSVLSKKNLYDNLAGLPIVPKYQILSRSEIMEHPDRVGLLYPFWVRDFAEGSTSGKGSLSSRRGRQSTAASRSSCFRNSFPGGTWPASPCSRMEGSSSTASLNALSTSWGRSPSLALPAIPPRDVYLTARRRWTCRSRL